MNGFKCPICGQFMTINDSTMRMRTIRFEESNEPYSSRSPHIVLFLYRCPNDECRQITVRASGSGNEEFEKLNRYIIPFDHHKNFPEFVPLTVRNDYEEACAIKDLSPKASATLSRRCLQAMIRDFWDVKDKPNLHQEIVTLRGKIDNATYEGLLNLKTISTFGAHPEMDINTIIDIEPNEAEQLLLFIELLIEEWYMAREKRKDLLQRIKDISDAKSEQKTS